MSLSYAGRHEALVEVMCDESITRVGASAVGHIRERAQGRTTRDVTDSDRFSEVNWQSGTREFAHAPPWHLAQLPVVSRPAAPKTKES